MSAWCVLIGFAVGLAVALPILAIRRGHPWGRREGDSTDPPQ